MIWPETWDEAAEAAVEQIFIAAKRDHVEAPVTTDAIRTHFDQLDNLVFNTEHKPDDMWSWKIWASLGAIAINWGKENAYVVEEKILLSTLIRKQHDYGHHNIARYGMKGLCIRVHDKIARLENLIKYKLFPNNESIADTVTDIAGYSAIGIMLDTDTFMLPLEKI